MASCLMDIEFNHVTSFSLKCELSTPFDKSSNRSADARLGGTRIKTNITDQPGAAEPQRKPCYNSLVSTEPGAVATG